VNKILEDSSKNIWLATNEGLIKFENPLFSNYPFQNNQLKSSGWNFILEGPNGLLWLGNSQGIASFDGHGFKFYSSQRLGLTDRSWITGISGRGGQLWFGSSEGITTFFPPPITINNIEPPVHVTHVKVMEKEVSRSGMRQFEYDENIFRFNFTGLSFISPSEVRYKYYLSGIDKQWQTTAERSLFYPFLPPGSYHLKVKAINADGIESEKAAEYRFQIKPPFWRTWWFFMIMILATGGFLVLGVQWRVKRAREKAELKAKNQQLVTSQRMELMGTLAAGTVHDLKNLLAVIIDYSKEISHGYNEDEENNENYRNITIVKDTAATAAQMAKQILSFARPRHLPHEPVELASIVSEILDTLKLTQPKKVQINWHPPAKPIFFPIHPGRLQQVVMNLCINAFDVMLEGGNLDISLIKSTERHEIILVVKDDSAKSIPVENLEKIFDPMFTTKSHGKGTGLGLFVVKQIVMECKGKIQVESQPGKGTIFTISFPVNDDYNDFS
jgi:signal transduction histidine kinase